MLERHSRGVTTNIHEYAPQYFETEVPRPGDFFDQHERLQALKDQDKAVKEQINEDAKITAQKAVEIRQKAEAAKAANTSNP